MGRPADTRRIVAGAKTAMTAGEVSAAIQDMPEACRTKVLRLDLGGMAADVLSIHWGMGSREYFVYLELGPIRLRHVED